MSDETRRLGSRLKGAIWLLDSEPKRLLGPDARRSRRRHAARPRRTPEGSGPGGGPMAPNKKGPSRPLRAETPCMSGTAYPPTDCTAVLSAMGSLTAGFGMGPGDPPLHGSAHAGRSPARDEYPVFNPGATLGVAWRSANRCFSYQIEKMNRDEELGRLVPLA